MQTNLLTKQAKSLELKIAVRTLDRRIKKGLIDYISVPGSKRKWFLPVEVDEYDADEGNI